MSPSPSTCPGSLFGRPDLQREEIVEAIAQRIAMDGGDPGVAGHILTFAERGNLRAQRILRRVVLPPPQSRLEMPVQDLGLTRERRSFLDMFRRKETSQQAVAAE